MRLMKQFHLQMETESNIDFFEMNLANNVEKPLP